MADKHILEDADRIIIVANPSFGAAFKFMLLGAVVGAGAMALLNRQGSSQPALPSPSEREAEHLNSRLSRLSSRIRSVAGRTRDVAGFAAGTLAPAIGEAVREGSRAAREMQDDLRRRDPEEDEVEKV